MPIVSFCDRKSAREMDRLIAEGPRNVHGWHTTIHLQRRDTTTALISYSADKKPKSLHLFTVDVNNHTILILLVCSSMVVKFVKISSKNTTEAVRKKKYLYFF